MSKLIMLVGLPASGKSAKAKELAQQYDAIIVSSDLIRKELFGDEGSQENNELVFKTLHDRINKELHNNKSVIYDATNINRKNRMHFINNEIKADEKIAYYLASPIYNCLYHDNKRGRTVGYDVIDRMYKNMNIPTELEGWDEVHFSVLDYDLDKEYAEIMMNKANKDYSYDEFIHMINEFEDEFNDIIELPHDSTYHSFSVSRHTYYVYKYVFDNYKGKRKNEMIIASMFHDIGKAHAKSFINFKGEEKRYASFIGHENVSAQIALCSLMSYGFDIDFVKYVVDLIQFHMMPHDMSTKTEKKLRLLLTEEQFSDLMFLNEADKQAH